MNVGNSAFRGSTTTLVDSGPLLGASEAMREVRRLIQRVGPTDANVLLTGESGSGKKLAAECIHGCSPRRQRPFIVLNCGAIPAPLIEGELFGQVRGNLPVHAGAFERAEGGTLVLDAVTELPADMQMRLLRVLETRKYYQTGTRLERNSDVRVIASSNRCPLQAVQNGRLREDLLYRIAEFPVDMPPLRSRGNDVDFLAESFLAGLNAAGSTHKHMSPRSRITLMQHTWPGNVRELRNCVERAFVLADLLLEVAPLVRVPESTATEPVEMGGRLDIRVGSRIHDMERSLIEATLDYFKGNKRRAADALGCSLKTLYNKLNGYSQHQECVSS